MPVDSECPIYDFKAVPVLISAPTNYVILKYTNEKDIIINRGEGSSELPVSEIILEEGQPCIKPKRRGPSADDRYYHPLEHHFECRTEVMDTMVDNRYRVVDRINLYDLYYENDIIDALKKIPNYKYKNLQHYENELYERRFIPWSQRCEMKSGITRANLVEKIKRLEFMQAFGDGGVLFCSGKFSFSRGCTSVACILQCEN